MLVANSATCDRHTPLGKPVVPEVQTITAGCVFASFSNGALKNVTQNQIGARIISNEVV